ncbi:GNAT family N-acetyltransferase [Luteibacter yeojuensis]|uniref:GNAT family N-acetyltransferase n=1 Tax=Luteibacter yeojuensis TaxID=345309 RepID=A0A7X5QSI0_9GAMM|nr:GNAT family N-acetyltransferase [Luteibacter yeojuensis]NID14603.1 GNAT family N-acetyltransferase [Luteibacter yeojuensis]
MPRSSTTSTPPADKHDFPAIEGDHWIEALDDGTPVLIRPLRPEDRRREEAFIRRLSAASRRNRFLGEIREASPGLLDQLMKVDYKHAMAFVALAHDNGELREVGISRYAGDKDGTRCECAVTVADDWRHRGLAVLLMRHLIEMARHEGFKSMYSRDLAENKDMRELASFLGFRRTRDPDDACLVIHSLQL